MAREYTLQENVLLAPHTTMGLGGPARYFAVCRTVEELCDHLAWAQKRGLQIQVLGGGSNTLFADQGFDGLVLKIDLRGLAFAEQGEWVVVRAGAGEDWDALVCRCSERGLGGIECLSGIPGLVGATPIQNVGAYGQEVKDTLVQVVAVDRQNLETVEFTGADCEFRYRQSRFKGADRDRYIITQVTYRLRRDGQPHLGYPELRNYVEERVDLEKRQGGRSLLAAVREAVLQLRRKKSMVIDSADPNARSVGSFFLNPVLPEAEFRAFERRWQDAGAGDSIPAFAASDGIKVAAAWLVERAGFNKGYSRGGVGISANHALALINCGGTTREVLELAAEIQGEVETTFGIRLEREPVVVGG
jgi:UDP-N-acetylmuramate dehydrogenase